MAYGAKFRLVFSDVKGNLRRVEILQKDYQGDVFPLVGQGNPVVIKWDGDDDFYSPIIGSSCELNLFETETTQYDQFFLSGEREYKVRVSTGSNEIKYGIQKTTNGSKLIISGMGSGGTGGSSEIYWEGWLQLINTRKAYSHFQSNKASCL
jgi:hypothetical protein